jgi:hypothetical protein
MPSIPCLPLGAAQPTKDTHRLSARAKKLGGITTRRGQKMSGQRIRAIRQMPTESPVEGLRSPASAIVLAINPKGVFFVRRQADGSWTEAPQPPLPPVTFFITDG